LAGLPAKPGSGFSLDAMLLQPSQQVDIAAISGRMKQYIKSV
jgi:hypothetical protein